MEHCVMMHSFSLNWTLFIEVPTLLLFLIFVFTLAVMLSIGVRVTCDDIGKFK